MLDNVYIFFDVKERKRVTVSAAFHFRMGYQKYEKLFCFIITYDLTFFSIAYILSEVPINPRAKLIFEGAFLRDHYDDLANDYMYFYLSLDHHNGQTENITEVLKFPIAEMSQLDSVKQIKRSKIIHLNDSDYQSLRHNMSVLTLNMLTHLDTSFPVTFSYDPSPLDKEIGIIFAAIILLGLYILIIWELVHRTFAAMVASTLAIGIFETGLV